MFTVGWKMVGTANRRISNIEPQNVEGWFRFAQSFFKIDRSTQKLTAGRIPYFDIRPARNALKLVRGEFNNLIHNSMITPTQWTMHGRRVFAFFEFLLRLDWPLFRPAAALIRLRRIRIRVWVQRCRNVALTIAQHMVVL